MQDLPNLRLKVLLHQFEGSLCIDGTQEAVDERFPAQRKLKRDVLLEVVANGGKVQVVA